MKPASDQPTPNLHELFLTVLDEVKDDLGPKRVDSIESTLYAAEPEAAFTELVSSLYLGGHQVTDLARNHLAQIAEGLGMLDYEHGKGRYW
jgi:hypothetical protein